MAVSRHVPGVAALSRGFIAPPGLFRLILAFAVVVSHLSSLDIGRLGVLLFFYLSGYWTARIWAEKFGSRDIWRFYLSRYWRIAPLFLAATLVAGWLRGQDFHLQNFTLLGLGSTEYDTTGVSWSLDVELQFYLMLPFVVALLAWSRRLAVVGLGVMTLAGWWLDARFGFQNAAKYLPAFAFGVLTFSARWMPSRNAASLSLAGFAAATAVTAATPFLLKGTPDPFHHDIWAMVWMLPLLPYVACSLTVPSSRLDRHLGNLSFPLYLVHFAAIALLTDALGEGVLPKALAVAASCIVALAAYLLLDRPIDRLRIRYTEEKRRSAAVTP